MKQLRTGDDFQGDGLGERIGRCFILLLYNRERINISFDELILNESYFLFGAKRKCSRSGSFLKSWSFLGDSIIFEKPLGNVVDVFNISNYLIDVCCFNI